MYKTGSWPPANEEYWDFALPLVRRLGIVRVSRPAARLTYLQYNVARGPTSATAAHTCSPHSLTREGARARARARV